MALLARICAVFVLLFVAVETRAATMEKFVHVERRDITTAQLFKNFGVKYGLQWAFYYASQHETIKDHGSWRNWRNNMFSPHFDRDNLENNIINHTLAGASYYLYYRSRGYNEARAFLWSNLSSVVFEFTIETFTERPSYQDLALTPTLGTAAGFVAERVSAYFHEKKVWPGRFLGFIFNPYSVFKHASYEFKVVPVISKEKLGASIEWSF